MATIGNIPSSWYGYEYFIGGSDNQVAVGPFTMPTDGVLQSITFYGAGATGSTGATGVVWDSGGNIIASGGILTLAQGSLSAGGQWWSTVGVSQTLIHAGTTIYIGWWRSGGGSGVWSETNGGTTSYIATGPANGPGTMSYSSTTSFGSIGAYASYTPVGPPTVQTYGASSVTSNSATLDGAAIPNGADTQVFYQWGTTSSLGNQTGSVDIGSGGSAVTVDYPIGGLQGGTTYYFRIAASNIDGTSYGGEVTFTTSTQFSAPNPPTLVSPGSGSILSSGNGVTLTAIYNSTDGYSQSAYSLRVSVNGGAYQYWNGSGLQTTQIWLTDSNNTASGSSFSVSLPSSVLVVGDSYSWSFASEESGNSLQGSFANNNTFLIPSTSHLPSWHAPINLAASVQEDVDQFHYSHQTNRVFDAIRQDDISTSHNAFYSFFQGTPTTLATAFKLNSGTTIGRVEIPLYTTNLSSCDVLVQLTTDNAGQPSTTVLAQTVIPGDLIVAMQTQTPGLTRFQQSITSSWKASSYPYPASTSYMGGILTPSNLVTVGGVTNPSPWTPITNCYIGQFNLQTGDYLSWANGTSYTIAAGNFAGATYLNGYLYVAGGDNNSSAPVSNVYSSAFEDATGQMGLWNAQQALPAVVAGGSMVTDGTYLYQLGGTPDHSTVLNTMYVTQPNQGNISNWSTITLPFQTATATVVYLNGYIIVAGGLTTAWNNSTATTRVLYAKLLGNGTLGPWMTGPSLPAARSRAVGFTFGNSLIVCGGQDTSGTGQSNAWTIGFNTSGSTPIWGAWTSMTNTLSPTVAACGGGFVQTNGSLALSCITGSTIQSIVAKATAVPYISVPLNVSGLTAGTKYWITITPLRLTPSNAPQTSQNTGSGDGFATSLNGSTWTVTANQSINIRVFDATVSGRCLNTLDDVISSGQLASDWRWMIWNELTGQLTAYNEMQPRTSQPALLSARTLQYDANGALIGTS